MTDRSILTRPGVIRKTIANGTRWVIIDPTHWRWLNGTHIMNCSTLSADPSEVIGCLPPDERDSTNWCDRYTLSEGCIKYSEAYEPVWDGEFDNGFGRWISRPLGDPVTEAVKAPKESFAAAAVRIFKKYW